MHLFKTCWLNTYGVWGTVLEAEDIVTTKMDKVLVPWNSYSSGGAGHSTTKQTVISGGDERHKEQESRGRAQRWVDRDYFSLWTGKACSTGTSDQITAGVRKWAAWSWQGEHPSSGTTEEKNWERGELGVLEEQELWLLLGVEGGGEGGVRLERWGHLIAKALLAVVRRLAFIPSVMRSHWQEREAIWLRFCSCGNTSKEKWACRTNGGINHLAALLLVTKTTNTRKWIWKKT